MRPSTEDALQLRHAQFASNDSFVGGTEFFTGLIKIVSININFDKVIFIIPYKTSCIEFCNYCDLNLK